ncbi:MAG: 30S ribosomal protein S5 [Candidatus ainarchaeum sp.]|nr:30S ribosomal protein S5 [Candidatus ainarchaeum sp.]
MNKRPFEVKKKRKRNDPESIAEKIEKELIEKEKMLTNWIPKTELGKKVQLGQITSMDEIFEKSYSIREPEIVDSLLKLEDEVVDTAKTTRVVRAGRKYSFRVTVLTGNKDGYVGIGIGKDVDRFPAIVKAKRQARLNLKKVYRGSGSWEEQPTTDKHSIPFKVTGKSGSVIVTLMPAPKGTGLTVGQNIKRVMELAGIQNIWGKAKGNSGNKLNFVGAAVDALAKTGQIKNTKDIEKKFSK